MDQLLKQITDLLSGIWDSPIVQLGLRAIAIYFVILWLAAAYWAFRDMQLRTANPFLPYLAASLVIIFTPVFFPFGIVAYRIVRPQEKIGEVYERTLAEEALLAEVEAVKSCPTCARRVEDEWIVCPTCRTRLNRVCPNCSRLVGLDWSLCAWCGRDFERAAPSIEAVASSRTAATYSDPMFEPRMTPSLEAASYRSMMSSGLSASRDAAVRDIAPPDFVRREARELPAARDQHRDGGPRLGLVRDEPRSVPASRQDGRGLADELAWPPPPPPAIVPPPPGPAPRPLTQSTASSRGATSSARSDRSSSQRTSGSKSGSSPKPSSDPLAEH